LKNIARFIGEGMNDDDLLELMHSVFIKNNTQSNGSFSFDEFYQVISQYYQRQRV
jgi:Ca2+-binding EF-hand superfamily protein